MKAHFHHPQPPKPPITETKPSPEGCSADTRGSRIERPGAVRIDSFAPRGHLSQWWGWGGEGLLLASGGWRPEMSPEQPPPQRILQPQIPIVLRLTDPGPEPSLGTWTSWSHFLKDYGKQHLQADLLLPARTTSLRTVSVLDQTDMPCLFRAIQIFQNKTHS